MIESINSISFLYFIKFTTLIKITLYRNLMDNVEGKNNPISIKQVSIDDLLKQSDAIVDTSMNKQLREDPLSSSITHYQELLHVEESQLLKQVNQHLKKLEINKILLQEEEYESFDLHFHPKCKSYEAMTVNVQMGKALFKINLLNVAGDSPWTRLSCLGSGSMGEVRLISLSSRSFVLKAIRIKETLTKKLRIMQGIKQYCLLSFASALKCGPFMKNYLGFDIVVYNDQLIFAMERITMVTCFTKKNENQLKDELKSLHFYKFIHFDIKPENVGFSPTLNKMVFLDFGLSQFIREPIGQRSKTFFRGSCSFCSNEMLDLFLKVEKKGLIDLYFNDAISLSKVCQFYQQRSHIINQNISQQQQIYFQYKQVEKQYITNLYILQLKFHLCMADFNWLKRMNEPLADLSKEQSRSILRFLRKITPFQLNREYHLFLENFKDLPEHQELINIIHTKSKHIDEKSSFLSHFNEQEEENYAIFQFRYDFGQKKQIALFNREESANLRELKINFIKNYEKIKNIDENHKLFNVFLDCIRFDNESYGINMKEKDKLCSVMAKIFAFEYEENGTPLTNIQKAITFLLEYCVDEPPLPWKRKYVLFIVLQSIYVDINISEYLKKIQQILMSSFVLNQKIIVLDQIRRINCLNIYLYKSSHRTLLNRILEFTINLKTKVIKEIFQHSQTYKESNVNNHLLASAILFIARAESQLIIDKFTMFQVILQKINLTCDVQTADLIKVYILYGQMHHSHYLRHLNYFQILMEYFKPIINRKWGEQIGFQMDYYLTIALHYQQDLGQSKQILKIIDKIKKTINCEDVYARFKFNFIEFLNKKDYNSESIHRYIAQFQYASKSTDIHRLKMEYYRFGDLIQRPQIQKIIKKEDLKKFRQIWKFLFHQFLANKNLHNCDDKYFEEVRQYAIIFTLCFETLEQSNLYLTRKFHPIRKMGYCQPSCTDCQLKEKLTQSIFYSLNFKRFGSYQESYYHFEAYYQCSLIFDFIKIVYYVLGSLAAMSNRFSISGHRLYRQQKSYKYHLLYFNLNKSRGTFLHYLVVPGCLMIYYALQSLHITNDAQNIYYLLNALAKTITLSPNSNHIEEWFTNVKHFCHDRADYFEYSLFVRHFSPINWTNCYRICYYILCLKDNTLQNSLILKKISLHLQSINYYSKSKIMEKYFDAHIKLENIKKRKQQLIKIRLKSKFILKYDLSPYITLDKLKKGIQNQKKNLLKKAFLKYVKH